MKRLFLALALPETIQDQLTDLQYGLDDVRWTPEEQLHLTLRFLGNVDGADQRILEDDLEKFMFPEQHIQLQGVNTFRSGVLWTGVRDPEPLIHLVRKLDHRLRRLRFPFADRTYKPHVTLGRFREFTPSIGRYMETYHLYKSEPFTVDRITLFSSILSPKGASHWCEREFVASGT